MASVKARTRGTRRTQARLDVSLNPEAKQLIEQAALVSNQSLTDFVVTRLLRASEETLQQHGATRLTNRDRDRFLAAMDSGARPNRALRNAAERFQRQYRKP